MADEVVGRVVVDVHGNVDPLKKDIRQAAQEAGKSVQPEMASEIDKDTSVTEAIVEQVEEAEKPAEQSSRKIGRAVIRGTRRGVRDGEPDLSASLDRLFGGMGRALEREAQTLSAGFKRMGAQVRSAFDDEAGNIQKASSDAGATITPNIARGINQTPAITEAIVGQVEDAVQPADQHGEEIGRSVIRGARRGVQGEEPTLRQSLDNLFAGMAESLERETPLLTAGFHRIGAQVRSIFQDEAGSIQQDIADAADAAGAGIGPTVAAGINKDAGITDAIVGQVTDAVAPSEDGGIDVGHAVMRGAQRGINDEQQNLSSGLGRLFDSMGRSLERQTPVVAAGFRRMTAQVRAIFTDETSAIGRVAQQAGSAIGPEIAAGIDADSSITDVIVEQVEDAVIPAEQAGGDVKDAIVQGIEEGLAGSLAQAVGDAVGGILPEIDAGISGDTSISTAITSQISAAQQPAEDAGHDTGIAAAHGVEEGLQDGVRGLSMDQLLKDMFDNLDDVLKRRTDETAKKTRVRIQEILRAGSGQRGSLMSDLLGPESMAELEAALARFKAVIEDENGRPRVRIDEDSFEEVLRDIDAISERIVARFEHQGSESSNGFQRGFQKDMKKAVSGGIFDALFKMLAGKVAGMGALVSFGIRAAAPIIVGLTSQITTAVVGLGEALGGLGIVGAGIGATLLPNMVALKFAMKGLDTDAKKALAKNFKEAAGDLAKFPDILRSTLIPRLLDAVRIVRQLSPEVSAFGRRTGEVAGDLAKNFAAVLGDNRKSIDTILTGSSETLKRLGQAATSLVDPLIDALAAMQPLINRAVNSIAYTIEGLARRLDQAVESGRFLETLERWYESGLTLLQGFKNLGTIVVNFFKIANNSQGNFVESFEKFTEKWADWTESIEGQVTLKKMFDEAKPVIEEVWGLLGDVVGLFTESFTGDTSGLVGFIRMIREDFIPFVEDLQGMVRSSGIQDALYGLTRALVGLFEAGGGSTIRTFLTVMTTMVEVLTDLLDLLGPIIGPLVTFVATIKLLQFGANKFSGLLALPAMITNLLNPISQATDALNDLGGAADGAGDRANRGQGRFARAASGFKSAAGVLEIAYAALVTAQQLFGSSLEKTGISADALTEKLKAGKTAGEAFASFELPTDWAGGARNTLSEIVDDLGGGKIESLNRKMAGLGIDIANVNTSRDALNEMFAAIQQYATETGDFAGAQAALDDVTEALGNGGVEASEYAAQMKEVKETIDAVTEASFAASAAQTNFTGNFKKGAQAAADSLNMMFDPATAKKIEDLYNVDRYIDPRTGQLNKEGMEERRKIVLEADLDSIGGVDEAIDDATEKNIRDILVNPKYLDENGNPTASGRLEIAKAIIAGLEVQKPALEAARAEMDAFFKAQPFSIAPTWEAPDEGKLPPEIRALAKTGRRAIKLFTEFDTKDFPREIEALFGSEMISKRIELEAKYKGDPDAEAKIQAELEAFAPQLLVEVSTDEAKRDMEDLMGEDWEAVMRMHFAEEDLIEVDGQLLRLTEDGKWEAVIGAEAETARAEEDITTMVEGPTGGWVPVIMPKVDPKSKSKAEKDLAALTETDEKWINIHFKTPEGKAGFKKSERFTLENFSMTPAMAPKASMISMGGPTMGGDTDGGISTFGISARGGGGPSIGTYASNGRYSSNAGGGEDELRRRPNVTVINNYPAPEKASDSIAMSLRLARWEMAGA